MDIWKQIQLVLNPINHTFIGLIALLFTTLGYKLNFEGTAMHAFMTMIGFHVLMAEALMSHYTINPLLRSLSYRGKSRVHGILQLVGGTMALLGAFGKYSSTEVHFTTWHGMIGLAASFMCFASIMGGILNFFQPRLVHRVYSPSELKFRHNLFGMVTFTLAMITILFGYRTLFFYKHFDGKFIQTISYITTAVYILTMIAPVQSLLYKMKYRNKKK